MEDKKCLLIGVTNSTDMQSIMAAYKLANETMTCFITDSADQCVFINSKMPNSDTEEWSAEAGANFHGCLKKSKGDCRAKFPEFTDCWESCGPPVLNVSYPVLKVSLALLAILAWFM